MGAGSPRSAAMTSCSPRAARMPGCSRCRPAASTTAAPRIPAMPEPRRRRRRSKAERRLRLAFGMAWRADPGLFVVCALTAIGSLAATLLYPIGFGVLVDGAITNHGSRIVIGVAIATVALPCSYVLQSVGSSLGIKLTDQTSMLLGLHIARLVNSAPFLEHFERPEYLAEIDTLRQRP